ncbi:MAG: hypothetical protein WCJ30_26810, partial [Deltaproteobacteria bacterium]
ACGTACPPGASCTAGACVCAYGTLCSGACVETTSSTSHCGACGHACGAGELCVAAACVCSQGQTRCGSTCTDASSDPANCGGCGTRCATNAVCIAGACQTRTGYTTLCGAAPGTYANTLTDTANCGACGTVCAATTPRCRSGVCSSPVCAAGQTNCTNRCVTMTTDPLNCGACGSACPAGQTCSASRCVSACPAGTAWCGNRCVSLAGDPNNCGACGAACPLGATCAGSVCTCPAGQTLCNGICAAGPCVGCGAGLSVCNASCANTQTDPVNCGGCGRVCGAGSICSSGLCRGIDPLHYTFNTPVGAPPASQCGRVVFSDFHVDNSSASSATRFPAECDNVPMTAQEKILEFMLFDLASCITPSTGAPACPAGATACGIICCAAGDVCQPSGVGTRCFTPYPPTGTYTQDIDASTTCAAGYAPAWSNVVLVATTPPGTSVDVTFYTASSAAGLSAATPVDLGTLPASTSPLDLRAALAAAAVSGVLPYGRIAFALNSDATHLTAPTVDGYQVNFTCQPAF